MSVPSAGADPIRRGGLRRLRAGLPIDGGPEEDRSVPRSIPAFNAEVDRLIAEATTNDTSALLLRIHHRPIPIGRTARGRVRLQLHPAIEERLGSLHPDQIAIALSAGDIMVFVPGLSRRGDGEELTDRCLALLEEPVDVDGLPHVLAPRIGSAVLDRDNPDGESLFEASEMALAETDISHRSMMFHPYQRARQERQVELEADLRSAILDRSLDVVLQPAVNLATGRIVAVEAFARWHRGDKGAVATRDLIDTAQSLGVLDQLGQQIFQKALFHLDDAVKAGVLDEVTLWLNVGPHEILERDLIRTILDGSRLNDSIRVGVELAPSPTSDDRALLATARALCARGVRAAIGDFGVGFADFAGTHQFPFDSAKLDRSLMTQIVSNDRAAEILRRLVSLTDAMGVEVTAQGLESMEQVAMLRDMGCPIGQGFVFAKPLPAESFRDLATDWDPTTFAG